MWEDGRAGRHNPGRRKQQQQQLADSHLPCASAATLETERERERGRAEAYTQYTAHPHAETAALTPGVHSRWLINPAFVQLHVLKLFFEGVKAAKKKKKWHHKHKQDAFLWGSGFCRWSNLFHRTFQSIHRSVLSRVSSRNNPITDPLWTGQQKFRSAHVLSSVSYVTAWITRFAVVLWWLNSTSGWIMLAWFVSASDLGRSGVVLCAAQACLCVKGRQEMRSGPIAQDITQFQPTSCHSKSFWHLKMRLAIFFLDSSCNFCSWGGAICNL